METFVEDLERKLPKKSPKPKRRNSKTKKTDKLSKDQLLLALEKKKQCNAKALKIVQDMLEPAIDKQIFLNSIKDINQCHMDDIIVERAIIQLCGYPLCSNALKDVPDKQYHICRASNKIYDITERKNFCSNKCFKSSNYIKEQMLTSPLWIREHEEIPEFQLLE